MLHRAYSLFEIKSVDDEQRVIEGFTSTPTPDRLGDVLDPKGAAFTLPLPLLWQHKQDRPIGQVIDARVDSKGIWIKATIAKDVLPFIEEAWALIKSGLVRGFSVGWKPDAPPTMSKAGTFLYSKWQWVETSAVTIPMNTDATIAMVKSLDDAALAAASGGRAASVSSTTPAVAGTVAAKRAAAHAPMNKQTIQERIKSLEATRAAKVAERDAIMDQADEKGLTLDSDQREQYDALDAEVKSYDEHLKRQRARETEMVSESAVEVKGATIEEAAAARGGQKQPAIRFMGDQLEPGQELARAVMCKMAAFLALQNGEPVSAVSLAKQHYKDSPRVAAYLELQQRSKGSGLAYPDFQMQFKAAVAAGTTTDSTWAAPLLAQARVLPGEFLEFLRAETILGKFGTTVNGVAIPSLRRVDFNVKIQGQTSGGTSSWVGQGAGKPVTKYDFDDRTLTFKKVAAISVLAEELVRFSSPSAELMIRDALAETIKARIDADFIDPAISAISNVRPASITNGLTAQSSAGTSAANVVTDIQNLIEPFLLAKVGVRNLVIIMPETLAMVLSLMLTSLGNRQFPDLEIGGGRLLGIPVITTQYAASEAQFGNMVIVVNARDIALADDGQVTIDASREASLQMDDAPTQSSATPTATSVVSMFQTNSIAIRAERFIDWAKLRSNAVVYMDDVNWGSIGSPV